MTNDSTLHGVIDVIVETLGIEGRATSLDASTPLLDSMPELDSLAIVQLVTELEERFGFEFEDEAVNGDVFESVGTLTAFVESRLA